MTSRETTGLLRRAGDAAAAPTRSLGDWAAVIGLGAITWPWLLRSLDPGRIEDKHKLLDRLGLPHDSLPHLGSWKADIGLLTLVADHIMAQRPKLVVEFGAGASSLIVATALAQAGRGKLISFEQHEDFASATALWLAQHGLDSDIRAAPLMRAPGDWPGFWYGHGPLPTGIDLMVIDGPPWALHPMTRGAAATLFDKIAPGGTIILDDAARPGERLIARRWRKMYPEFEFSLWTGGSKGTLIGTKRG